MEEIRLIFNMNMRAKTKIIAISIILVFTLGFAFSVVDYPKGKRVYVKTESESLLDEPKGDTIGTLSKGADLIVLEDSPEWVKVRLVGWIKKSALTDSRLALRGDGYRALQIIVKELTAAEEILRKLKTGVDFKELAKQQSIGPAAQKGGDLGYFNKGDFRPEFEQVILTLKVGEFSEIVKSELGYHIFKRVE